MRQEEIRYDVMQGEGKVRRFTSRWVIRFRLEALTALHLGGGEAGDTVDLGLLRDRAAGLPLLTGASLAGGLREALCRRLLGDRQAESGDRPAPELEPVWKLFGGQREDPQGLQGALVVFDALGSEPATAAIRDGVRLDPESGTAADHGKFDLELWPPRTSFDARVDLQVPEGYSVEEEARLVAHLAVALEDLAAGALRLGAKVRRGLGRCTVRQVQTRRFPLGDAGDWAAWLAAADGGRWPPSGDRIDEALRAAWGDGAAALGQSLGRLRSRRASTAVWFELPIRFRGGVLVGSPQDEADGADVRHLRSGGKPILSGTSLAGALRQRALRIARQVREDAGDGERWVAELFGSAPPSGDGGRSRRGVALTASRLWIDEVELAGGKELEVTRIALDRFTQAPRPGALLQEEPVFGARTRLRLSLELPADSAFADALQGLLLLLLKDLLLGEIPLGGTVGVGRGAVLPDGRLTVGVADGELAIDPAVPPGEGERQRVEGWVTAFRDHPQWTGAADQEPRSQSRETDG